MRRHGVGSPSSFYSEIPGSHMSEIFIYVLRDSHLGGCFLVVRKADKNLETSE